MDCCFISCCDQVLNFSIQCFYFHCFINKILNLNLDKQLSLVSSNMPMEGYNPSRIQQDSHEQMDNVMHLEDVNYHLFYQLS